MNGKPSKPRLSVSKTLRATPLFAAFSDADMKAVVGFCDVRSLAREEILFREGETCSAVYCLVRGQVKLYVSGSGQHKKVVDFINPGRTFAESAMFSGQGYSITAMALEDSLVIAIDAFSLMRYLRQHPELAWPVLAEISQRLHYLIGQVRSLSLRDSEQRLAAFLLDNYDREEPERPVARVPVMRAELASMLGQSTETLCRKVADFRRKGWIDTDDRSIFVRDPEALQTVANRPRR